MKKWILIAACAGTVLAQQLDLSRLDGLAEKAKETANVNLDADKLGLASGLVGGAGGAKDTLSKLKGIQVRTFEFEAPGAYSQADLDAIRSQVKGANWSQVVDVRSKNESAGVWFYMENGKPAGLVVIAAEPKELVVVNIVGPIDLNELGKITGKLGIPDIMGQGGKPKSDAPKKDE